MGTKLHTAQLQRYAEAKIDNEGENDVGAEKNNQTPQPDSAATPSRPRLRLVQSKARRVDPDVAEIEAAKRGDSAAFGALFERHMGRVTAMCTRMLKSRADVEDAVQQTFLEAWRSLHRFEGRSLFSTWITRIAIHTCLGHRRKLKRLFLTDDVEGPAPTQATFSASSVSPHEAALHVRTKNAIDDVLQRISVKKRAVFVLAELEGMTAPEIGEVLGIPEATVRTRLFHARKAFAKRAKTHPVLREHYALEGDTPSETGAQQ